MNGNAQETGFAILLKLLHDGNHALIFYLFHFIQSMSVEEIDLFHIQALQTLVDQSFIRIFEIIPQRIIELSFGSNKEALTRLPGKELTQHFFILPALIAVGRIKMEYTGIIGSSYHVRIVGTHHTHTQYRQFYTCPAKRTDRNLIFISSHLGKTGSPGSRN